jgi:hypothetical protein
MIRDLAAEESFVVALDISHSPQFGDEPLEAQDARMLGSNFVLFDVLTFKSPGKIHWQKPAHQVATEADRAANEPGSYFANASWC